MNDKRLLYLDIVRIFACLCILIIHFNASVSGYDIFGKFVYPNHLIPNAFFDGVYLGNIGVGLFFIISGAGLQYSHKQISMNKSAILHFYFKRAKSLYPMFWIAWAIATIISFIHYKAMPMAKLRHMIVSLCGLDGYAMIMLGKYYEFYQVGEWFLGCIIIIYLLYPFISYFANKHPLITAFCVMGGYFCLVDRVVDFFFILQLPYFLLGIFFVKYFNTAKDWRLWCGIVMAIFIRVVFAEKLGNLTIAIISCSALFLAIVLFTEVMQDKFLILKNEKILKYISRISILTYPAFLVHHKLISMIAAQFNLQVFPYRYTVMLFIIYMMLVCILSVVLDKITKKILNCMNNI